jgi:hypothetical protein
MGAGGELALGKARSGPEEHAGGRRRHRGSFT